LAIQVLVEWEWVQVVVVGKRRRVVGRLRMAGMESSLGGGVWKGVGREFEAIRSRNGNGN
jgi:hypothetical protein